MNDERVRERARERLAAVELATVLGVDVVAVAELPTGERRTGWIAAATVLFGIAVAVGVAVLRGGHTSPLQEPTRFDPIDPAYERDFPFTSHLDPVRDPADLDRLPPEAHALSVASGAIAAVTPDLLLRRRVRTLALDCRGGDELDAAAWQRIATVPGLEVLVLHGAAACPPQDLRQLRHAPMLRHVQLFGTPTVLDVDLARVLVELPHLSALTLGQVTLTRAGVAALNGLPHLDTLVLSQVKPDDAVLAALAQLRQLRMLMFDGDDGRVVASAGQLARLATLPKLRVLEFGTSSLDDDALRAMPPQLESLVLARLDDVTPQGLAALARLRGLRCLGFRALLPPPLRAALADVVRALPLEHYENLVEAPDPALWNALTDLRNLRRLTLRVQAGARFADVVSRCLRLARLERLVLAAATLPEPASLAPLRDHPTLHRVTFRLDRTANAPTAAAIDALRAAVRATVDVVLP